MKTPTLPVKGNLVLSRPQPGAPGCTPSPNLQVSTEMRWPETDLFRLRNSITQPHAIRHYQSLSLSPKLIRKVTELGGDCVGLEAKPPSMSTFPGAHAHRNKPGQALRASDFWPELGNDRPNPTLDAESQDRSCVSPAYDGVNGEYFPPISRPPSTRICCEGTCAGYLRFSQDDPLTKVSPPHP
mgnify:CR=1 FL=1|jgi:hypothetical protein